ncbi:MAG: phospholipid carrier-dependent glycosyltransferase, partial [Burkholderiales bacterium]|nr:phospholipid carrier-dependent glycosyltransferase [Anaerolineae bacterium]
MKPEYIRLTRMDYGLMLVLFIGALALRLIYVIPAGFDGLYGQDPFAYYDFAAAVRTGQSPAPLFWPLGYPALLVASFIPFGPSAAAGQIASLTLGALLSVLVYVLARQLGIGRQGAIIAGVLMAICGQAVQSSLVLMADIPALAWATISALSLRRYLQTERRRWLLLAALLLALATITRWLYLWLAPIWALTVVLAWYQRGTSPRQYLRDAVLAAITAALIFVPQFAYSARSPYPTLNHAWVEGWTPANALSREFVNVDGQFNYTKVNAVYYAQPFYDPYYLAPVFAPLLLIGAWHLRRRRLELALLLGWVLLPYIFLAGIPYQNLRFPLIIVPAVVV